MMAIFQKDLVSENNHPLNLVEGEASDEPSVIRPPIFEVYMRMAEELAKRSTCARLKVGTVITDPHLENVIAIGYNGNARSFPNECDQPTPGACGCIHSEQNALVKAPGGVPDKVAFITASPCVTCAKLLIQGNISHVFYREIYRDPSGLDVLARAGVTPVHYVRWMQDWR
jgi:dCMP deaminase